MESYQRDYDSGSEIAPKARQSVEGAGMLPYKGEIHPKDDKGRNYPASVAQPVMPLAPERREPISTSPSQRALHDKMRNRRRR